MAPSSSSVLSLAAQIVSAHVENNEVSPKQLPALISSVHRALLSVGQAKTEELPAEPAVPVKRSVFDDHIICLGCGKQFSMLKRHLKTEHELTPELYRRKWQLPASYPLVAPNYAKTRSTLAKEIGLGRMRLGLKSARTKARQT